MDLAFADDVVLRLQKTVESNTGTVGLTVSVTNINVITINVLTMHAG